MLQLKVIPWRAGTYQLERKYLPLFILDRSISVQPACVMSSGSMSTILSLDF